MEKLTLKQVKLPIEKFNSTIRVQLDQLRGHKREITKFLQKKEDTSSYEKVKKEEINAIRLIKQMKTLIVEITEIRNQVLDDERKEFDSRIPLKDEALKEIHMFLAMELQPPDKCKTYMDDDTINDDELPPIQTYFQLTEYQLKARTAMLQDVVQLEKDCQDLFGVFQKVQVLVHEQAEPIAHVTQNVECAQISVEQGNQHLRTALKYQKAAYPLLGAVIGTCVAGPFGLLVGLKTGGILALGGGMLGYTGGKVLKKDELPDRTEPDAEVATQAVE